MSIDYFIVYKFINKFTEVIFLAIEKNIAHGTLSHPITAARGAAFPCRHIPGDFCQSSQGGS